MPNLPFNIGFFNSLYPNFRLFGVGRDIQTIHLGTKANIFPGSQRPGFAFKFS